MKLSERLALLSTPEIQTAREWLAELAFEDADPDYILSEAEPSEIVLAIAQHYEGGWMQFLLEVVA